MISYRPLVFRREEFDAVGFFADIERCMLIRETNAKELSGITGISESTLSRVRAGTQVCDAASLAALSAWAGINPANYCTRKLTLSAAHMHPEKKL